jgi:methylenetetrahydrofolate reductase (NADPH)
METPNISIEFFPPKTPEGAEKLRVARQKLAELQPKYFSVTFGAGGSTQQGTLDTVLEIQSEGHVGAPHLSCVGGTRESIRDDPARFPVARHPPSRGPARRLA